MQDTKLKIFISYAHEDKKLCEKFLTHLNSLKRADLISHWYDSEIKPGQEWNEEIRKNLNESDLIIFLLSPELLASEYVYENELKLSIKKHQNKEALVIPVMLRNCNYKHTFFSKLQGLPEGFIPIKSKEFKYIDDAFLIVITGLEKTIDKIIKDKKNNKIVKSNKNISTEKEEKRSFFWINNLFSVFKEKPEPASKYIETDLISKVKFLENERIEISRELHDNIASNLIVIKHQLLIEFDKNDQKVSELIQIVSKTANQIRHLSHAIHQEKFQIEFNLKESLFELEKHFIKISSINFNFNFDNLSEFHNPIIEVNSFRIIQELLNNVINHSQANNCDIMVRYYEKVLYIIVQDDGIGFELDEKLYNPTGLLSIIDRVKYYNGKINIDSHPEKGSKIAVQFKISNFY